MSGWWGGYGGGGPLTWRVVGDVAFHVGCAVAIVAVIVGLMWALR